MSVVSQRQAAFVAAWEFEVKPECVREFEEAYGPTGDWVRLFRTADGYIRTELHREPEDSARYITLDFWRSPEEYEAFKQNANDEYQRIDKKCERLTQNERLLGDFADELSVREAFAQLGTSTLVAPGVMLRRAAPEDIPAIIKIERSAASAAHWTEPAYTAMFQPGAQSRIVLAAENAEKQLCGFLVARIAADECELENVVVAPHQIRQGVGSALLQELLKGARASAVRRVFLEVRKSNEAARNLYQKLGFAQEGRRDSYYTAPSESAILYSLALGQQ